MTLRIGDTAPDFEADTTEGPLRFHDALGGGWAILFSHPADFTPVCTTELGAAARLKPEFDRRGVKVFGLSVDSVADHHRWKSDIEETQGTALNFPLIADPDRAIATAYGMLHPGASATHTVRSVFVIGPDKQVKLTLTYPMAVGRNFDEILRAVDALQRNAGHNVALPADWRPGGDVIIPLSVDDAKAAERFPGFRKIKPYLRVTADPAKP